MITYHAPDIPIDISRPTTHENRGFPYQELGPRRFEELIYSLYKNEIGSGDFLSFKDIKLMSGTKDLGRDCVLVTEGKNMGLIQCKRYERNLTIEDIGNEMTRFAMYALIETDLIHSVDNFTYFIASAKGFDNVCISFLNDFNNQIISEPKLDKWIAKQGKNPVLKDLMLQPVEEKIKHILSQIKVRMIGSNDLDELLIQPKNLSVVDLFFKVKTIIDEKGIKKIEGKIDQLLARRLSDTDLALELYRGSTTLSSEKNYFEGIENSHIERPQTDDLLNWLSAPAEKSDNGSAKNLCLLVGNAGMGKTVIIRDVYERLLEQNIPVLAVKADKIYASNLKELQEKINLSLPVHEMIDRCLELFPKLVLMIDQIDALSQSLSANREFLSTYTQLISYYKGMENLRIVISVRYFDLYYDPGLRIYKNVKAVEVGPLTKEMSLGQLEKLGIREKEISSPLLALLQIPNNLDVFSRIFSAQGRFSEINSLQDLYAELYRIKILHPTASSITTEALVGLVKSIVEQMYVGQKITISELLFENFASELAYLKTEQLIKIENGRVQFFHQTFYDYLYAKEFIGLKVPILVFVRRADQSMMIRSGLKMILNFTRETDPSLYIGYLNSILRSRSVRFHLKHLVVTTLATEKNPTDDEKTLVLKVVCKNFDLFAVFCERMISREWTKVLITENLLAPFKKAHPEKAFYRFDGLASRLVRRSRSRRDKISALMDIQGQMLRRNIHGNEDLVLGFCEDIYDIQTVKWLLFNNREWKNPTAISLFEKCFPDGDSDHHGFYMVLENISEVDPHYVFNKIKDHLTILDRDRNTSLRQNQNSKMLMSLMDKIPEAFLDHVTQTVIREGKTLPGEPVFGKIIPIYNVKDILKKSTNFTDTDSIYKLLGLGMRRQAADKTPYFRNYLNKYLHSELNSIVQIITFALQGNEKYYTGEIISLFSHMKTGGALNHYDELNDGLRKLISNVIPHLNREKVEQLGIDMLDLRSKHDFDRYHKNKPDEIYYPNAYGRTLYLYLVCIPAEIVLSNSVLKRVFQELKRKFGKLEHFRDYLGPGRTPVKESAYERMDFGNWIKSFLKYNSLKQTVFSPLGGLYEHSERYGEELKKDVKRHNALIRETVYDERINLAYAIKGLQALKEDGQDISELLKHTISRRPERMDLYNIVQLCRNFVTGPIVDREIFGFLLEKSQNPDRSNGATMENDVYRNTVEAQERVIDALMHVRDAAYAGIIFERLSIAMSGGEGRIQKFIMVHSAYLLALDTPRTIELFITNSHKIDSAKKFDANAWSLSYLVHRDFQGLRPIFERVLGFEPSEKTDENAINVLMGCLYADYPGAKGLFWEFFHKSEDAKAVALSNAFENFYIDGNVVQANLDILYASLGSASKKVRHRFKIRFLHIEHIKFTDLEEWLSVYAVSKSFVLSDYFLDYLTANVSTHPKKCIELFELAMSNKQKFSDPETNEMRSDEAVTKFIIGAYNALPSSEKNQKRSLMRLFDNSLKDLRLRKSTESVLDRIIE